GCWLHERWKLELALRLRGDAWLDLCNRHETLLPTDAGRARVCTWPDTSALTACRVFPRTGAQLLGRCLKAWPVRLQREASTASAAAPQMSVIIAFRGLARLPQLRCCLASLWGQETVPLEIIVVEQSWEQLLDPSDWPGVRLLHAKSTHPDMAFNKSWALNLGAKHARSDALVFHDADMIAPSRYAIALQELFAHGFEGARVPRFVFYLDMLTAETVQATHSLDGITSIPEVQANCRGVSLAMTRDAYWRIGGHDESFFGWGGEDDEFLQRARTCRFYPGGFVPFIHLWHEAQKEKHSATRERVAFTQAKLASPVDARIRELLRLDQGVIAGPADASP
ncbi:MAG: galactosyltransferase-related protein, partial [Pseudomonadota bacterium]